MKRSVLVLAAAATLAGFTYPSWTSTKEAENEAAIRATVENYFGGMMHGDPQLLREAFHADSRLMAANGNGELTLIPFDRWASSWGGQPALDAATHQNRILDIDIHGTAAVAKTELTWPNVKYIDYLSLIQVGDEWKIVNKIWSQETP